MLRFVVAAGLTALAYCQEDTAAAEYPLQAGAARLEEVGRYRLGIVGQRAIFDTSDLEAICYMPAPGRKALVLRAGERFFAMNGQARDHLAGHQVTWLRRRQLVVDPYPAGGPIAEFASAAIQEGLRACPLD